MSEDATDILVALADFVEKNRVFPRRDRFFADQSARIRAFDALEQQCVLECWFRTYTVWTVPALIRIAATVPFAARELRCARMVFDHLKHLYLESLDAVHDVARLPEQLEAIDLNDARRALILLRGGSFFHRLGVFIPKSEHETFGLTEQILRTDAATIFGVSRAVAPPTGDELARHPETDFASTFISYGGPDEAFARKLNAALETRGIKTFIFCDDAAPGERLHKVMGRGVNEHDRVILICSRSSLERAGLLNELEETLAREARDGGRTYLLPVRLDDYVIGGWQPKDSGRARALRDRVIADFRNHEDPERFEAEVAKLVAVLRRDPA